MVDNTAVVTDTEEKNPFISEVREKTFSEILKEQAESRNKSDNTPDPEEEKKKEEELKAKEEKEKQELEESRKKHDEEVALKAAQDVIDKQKEEEKAKEDALKAEEDEKKRQEDLKPKFTGKDKDGNVVPLSYEELTAESVRIAEEKALERFRLEQSQKEAKIKEEQDTKNQTAEQQKEAQKTFEENLQKELDSDLASIYAAGDMPKIKDPKDEKDVGNREFKNLFETAQKVNGERIAKGLPPIRSIQVIRYAKDEKGVPYYKPLEKLPGHDAPVLGSESTISKTPSEDKYIPSRDRHKSMAQLIKEEAERLGRKLNVRGN